MNPLRDEFIRLQAKRLLEQYRRIVEQRSGAVVRPIDILPIDPWAIARLLLGVTVEEPEEAIPQAGFGKIHVAIAGLVDRRNNRLVVIRRMRQEVRRFTLAHEIGHWLLHREVVLFRETPVTDASLRSPSTPREREANVFAAELLMPGKLVAQISQRRFGPVAVGPQFTDDQAFYLTGGSGTASMIAQMAPLEIAKLVADASSFVSVELKSLAEIFIVSSTAMGIQLLDLGLVKVRV